MPSERMAAGTQAHRYSLKLQGEPEFTCSLGYREGFLMIIEDIQLSVSWVVKDVIFN